MNERLAYAAGTGNALDRGIGETLYGDPFESLPPLFGYSYQEAFDRYRTLETTPRSLTPLEEILNTARWAPSGDNTQPWRFQIVDEQTLIIFLTCHGMKEDVYEFRQGEPTILSCGMLLENLRIAASAQGRGMTWNYDGEEGKDHHRLTVHFPIDSTIEIDRLIFYIATRSVNRKPYHQRDLTSKEIRELQSSLGNDLELVWHRGFIERCRIAAMSATATAIRSGIEEAFRVHQRIIDWVHPQSSTGIPAGALGMSFTSLALMRWGLKRWERMRLLDRVGLSKLGGLEMDFVPILCSSRFLTIRLANPPSTGTEHINTVLKAGQAIQRFWLTATRRGLSMQPMFGLLAFSHYGEISVPFTTDPAICSKARRLAVRFQKFFKVNPDQVIFMGRIGEPHASSPANQPRSIRHSLDQLMRRS